MVFFGSSNFSVFCLEELKTNGILPILIVTTPDMPTGRGLKLTPTPVKIWADGNKITCLSPIKLDSNFISELNLIEYNLFLVASYGKILPDTVINLPKYKTLNIHPSLLPKYRGPSPLQTQILNNEQNIGVTIMLMDELVDHGPIIAQEKIPIPNWPVKFDELEKITAIAGAKIFFERLNDWLKNKIIPEKQNHSEATFTKKVKKGDGLTDLTNEDPYKNFLKIQAYNIWPQAYFFIEKNNKKIRIIIKDAIFKNGQLEILRVLPEGKKEMLYKDFLRGF